MIFSLTIVFFVAIPEVLAAFLGAVEVFFFTGTPFNGAFIAGLVTFGFRVVIPLITSALLLGLNSGFQIKPVKVGWLEGRSLFLNFRIYGINNTQGYIFD